jgi:hypothetical protein
VLVTGVVLLSGWLYLLDRVNPGGDILTRKTPVIIGLFPVVVALALVVVCIIVARVAAMPRQPD